jgi:hypothetical protein
MADYPERAARSEVLEASERKDLDTPGAGGKNDTMTESNETDWDAFDQLDPDEAARGMT